MTLDLDRAISIVEAFLSHQPRSLLANANRALIAETRRVRSQEPVPAQPEPVPPVLAEPARTAIWVPPPDRHVLACRCGRSLGLADMHTRGAGHYGNGDPKLGAITCADCAHTPDRSKR